MRSLKILLLSVATFATLSASGSLVSPCSDNDQDHGTGMGVPSLSTAAIGGNHSVGTPEALSADRVIGAADQVGGADHGQVMDILADSSEAIQNALYDLFDAFPEDGDADPIVKNAIRAISAANGNILGLRVQAQSMCPAFAAAPTDRSSSNVSENAEAVDGSRDVHPGSGTATPNSPRGDNSSALNAAAVNNVTDGTRANATSPVSGDTTAVVSGHTAAVVPAAENALGDGEVSEADEEDEAAVAADDNDAGSNDENNGSDAGNDEDSIIAKRTTSEDGTEPQ